MYAFMSQFQQSAPPATGAQPPDRKRKDVPASPLHGTQRSSHSSNNAGEDAEMAIPPDPRLQSPQDVNGSFDSALMMEFADNIDEADSNPQLLPPESGPTKHSHVTRSKSAMKKE